TFPLRVEYVDVLPLDQLRTADGKQATLRAGDEITYWLEAIHNNDFGRPNIGKSKTYKITIEEGRNPALEQKKDRHESQQQEEQKQNDLRNQLRPTAEKLNDALDKSKSEQKGASDPSNSQNENKAGNKSPDKSGEEKSPTQEGAKGGNESKSDSTKSEADKKD